MGSASWGAWRRWQKTRAECEMQPSPLYSACTYSESVQLQRPARAQAAQGCVEAQNLIGIGLVLLIVLLCT